MARAWRIQYEDAVYHVISRGNHSQNIFFDDRDRSDFLNLLGRFAERFHIDIFAFCLMSNHYHLFLRTPEANLAKSMHWLNTAYANHFLRRHQLSGHFLQGRYKAVLITSEEHWHNLSFYIHLNPVRAGLVPNPAEYKWSSFLDYIAATSRFSWLRTDELLAEFGSKNLSSRRHYHRACLELAGVESSFWDKIRTAIILGSKQNIDKIRDQYRPKGDPSNVPQYQTLGRKNIEPDEQCTLVAEAFKVSKNFFTKKKRNFLPKLAAYYHLVENCGLSQTRVAKIMKVSPMAVSKGIKALNAKFKNNPELQSKLKSLKFKV